METVLPNEPPYILRVGKKVTINFGDPIDLNELVKSLKERNIPEPEARKVITDRIEEELDVSEKHFFYILIFIYCKDNF